MCEPNVIGNCPRLMTTLPLQRRKELPVWKTVLPVALKTREKTAQGNFISTNQKHYLDRVVTSHQNGISALVTQMSFCEGSSGDLAKRWLFSQANLILVIGLKEFKIRK